MDFLAEYETSYVRGNDGFCYKVTDEGYRTKVADHYCGRGSREVREGDKVEEVSQNTFMVVDRIEEIISNLARNISTSSNIPTQEKIGLIEALKELKEYVEDLGAELEMNETKKPVKKLEH